MDSESVPNRFIFPHFWERPSARPNLYKKSSRTYRPKDLIVVFRLVLGRINANDSGDELDAEGVAGNTVVAVGVHRAVSR